MTYCRPAIARMTGYVPGEQPKDRRYTKLNTNENPYPPSPRVRELLCGLDCARLKLYPDPVAEKLRDAAGRPFALPREWVLCGNGSDDLLTIAVRTFVDQGGTLAFPTPSYSLYPVLADIQAAKGVRIELDECFELPGDVLEQAEGASLLFLCRPNAPTGNAFPIETMRAVCRGFRGIVWIDEAYADFARDHCVDLVREYPNVVVSRTVSKSYSLAAIRLGVAFANPDLVQEMMKVKDSYNVGMLTQLVGTVAFEDREYMLANVARVCATRERVCKALVGLGFTVLPSESNFVFVRPSVSGDVFAQGLRDRGILVRYFAGERTGGYVRVTVGSDEDMDLFLAASEEVVRG